MFFTLIREFQWSFLHVSCFYKDDIFPQNLKKAHQGLEYKNHILVSTFFNEKAIGQYECEQKLKKNGYRLPVWHREGLDNEDLKKNHVNLMVRRELLDGIPHD